MLEAARAKMSGAKQKLAGKYNQLMDAAIANPSAAMAAGALGAGGLGAAGSLVGNLTDAEQDEGPLRLLTEAVNAGLSAAPLGALGVLSAGSRRRVNTDPRAFQEMQELHRGPDGMINSNAVEATMKNLGRYAAGSVAAIPLAAGLGGMMGGGTANMYNAMGVPGFAPGSIPDPEEYGSNNMPIKQYM